MKRENKSLPPRWAERLLEWRCPPDHLEEVQGDLHELFGQWVEEAGERRARWRYGWSVLGFLRPMPDQPTPRRTGARQHQSETYSSSNFIDMLRDNIKIALRNLLRHKGFSLLNISSLALGIACCLLIFLVVRYELSFDTHFLHADRVYTVNTRYITDGSFAGGAPMPFAQALQDDFPEVEQATTTLFVREGLVKVGQEVYKETGVVYAAPEYFSILNAHWLAGSPATSLAEPNAVVLTQSLALKYFGGPPETLPQRALGTFLTYKSEFTLQVTGLLQDFPPTTDLPFQFFISWRSLKIHNPGWDYQTDWIGIADAARHFVLLREGTDPSSLQAKFPAFENKHMGELEASRRTHLLQPLRQMHFDERFGNYSRRTVSKVNLGGLILIGLFIQLIACINFINLATAQAVKRSKEVGVRKVLGANRPHLVRQFLAETGLLTFLATAVAAWVTYLVLPHAKALLSLDLAFNPFGDIRLLAFLFLLVAVVSLLAGVYPALALSGYKPVLALQNKINAPRTGTFSLRRSLIVVQFGIAQVLIICTLVVAGQLEYFRSKPLGFDKEAIVTVPIPGGIKPETETTRALRNRLEQLPGIERVSFATFAPSSEINMWNTFTFAGHDPTKEYYVQFLPIDHTYLQTYGLTLVAGKNLDVSADSASILVNEEVLRTMGIPNPEAAIGQQVNWAGQDWQIAGVVKDFHTGSLKGAIPGVLMRKWPHVHLAGFKLEPANLRQTLRRWSSFGGKPTPRACSGSPSSTRPSPTSTARR